MKPYRVAVDIGGTFVDGIVFDRRTHSIRLEKSSTTPQEPWRGVLDVLDKLGCDLRETDLLIHGTTLGINAILQRQGEPTGIITNEGFRDIFEIGRGSVPAAEMYNFRYERPPPLVKRRCRLGVRGRINVKGEILEELDEKGLVEAARHLVEEQGVRSIALVFLHSYKNPLHERRAAEILKQSFPDLFLSTSSDITGEYREYERTSTTVLDAFIRPIYQRYVEKLQRELAARGFTGEFLIMRSSGGAMTSALASRTPIFTVMSGPAGGIVGTAHLAKALGRDRMISVDFGGTSLDACLIEGGEPTVMHETSLEHYPALIPIYDIRSIGAGGGSLAWLEEGLLKVGPQSAGAEPGPVAYGKGGTRPTTTDAALALGYLDPGGFLKGEMLLDAEASRKAIEEQIARPLGLDVIQAASGIFDIVMAHTVGAIREITVERGHDPQEFTLLAFGGAGPLFGPLLAREMRIPETLIPLAPAAFSAWGMLMADLAADFSRTAIQVLEEAELRKLEEMFLDLEQRAVESLKEQGVEDSAVRLERALELRYLGQEHALEVDVERELPASEIRERFERLHQVRYGHKTKDPVQVVTLRVRGRGVLDKPALHRMTRGERKGTLAPAELRDAFCFARRSLLPFKVYRRELLGPGDRLPGPAIVDEGTSTTVIHSDQSIEVDAYGQLLIRTERAPGGND
jgi:N-methylhydantoinase A